MRFKMLGMSLALLILAATVIWAVYMPPRTPRPTRPPDEVGTPQLRLLQGDVPPFYGVPAPELDLRYHGVPALEWDLRYHVGMSRDQIRQGLPRDIRWLASVSRPTTGWRALQKDHYAVVYWVTDFEANHPGTNVAACDSFDAGGGYHFLFYDGSGVLIGFKRIGGVLVSSAATGPANHRAEVDAGFAILFAFRRPWPGTT
jgi:hypothetical protein